MISKRKRNLIFINIIISCIATSMLATALATALTPICKDLGIDLVTGQWMTSGYSLVVGIVLPLTAFLIRRFPTKPLYLLGIILFMVGSACNYFSVSFETLMIGRVLQACGNGLLISMAQVIILTIFPPHERGSVMGWYGLAIGSAPVIAPTLAGVLVDVAGWRSIFLFTFLIMLVSLAFAYFIFDNVLETSKIKFDISSFILSIFAFGGVTLGIGNLSTLGLKDTFTILPLGLGIIGSILFVIRQLKLDVPFLDVRIFKIKEFTISVIGSVLLYCVMMGSSIIIPLYVQSILGYSATISGLVTLPGSLAMTIFSPIAGKIYDKIGIKKLAIIGAVFMFLSSSEMYFINIDTPIYVASIVNVIRCIAIGCLLMPLVTWGTSYVPQEHISDASALITSLRTIAGAIGATVYVGIMTLVSTNSTKLFGENAPIHGLNVSFAGMAIVSLLLLIVFCFISNKDNKEMICE